MLTDLLFGGHFANHIYKIMNVRMDQLGDACNVELNCIPANYYVPTYVYRIGGYFHGKLYSRFAD